MNLDVNNHTIIVLAGGNSSRMGYPKLWLKTTNGKTFLKSITDSYLQYGVSNIIVVINKAFTSKKWEKYLLELNNEIILIENNKVEEGRLHSLKLGLNKSTTKLNIIHNVDNPYVEYSALDLLLKNNLTQDISIPSYKNKGGHPVVINKVVKDEILNNYRNYNNLKELFLKFNKKYIPVNTNSILTNINTPKDLEAITYESVC